MIRVRVTFTVSGMIGSITHEVLVPEVDNDIIRQKLNEDMFEMLTPSLEPMIVNGILLVAAFPQFSPSD
jgi:hypothetical protein